MLFLPTVRNRQTEAVICCSRNVPPFHFKHETRTKKERKRVAVFFSKHRQCRVVLQAFQFSCHCTALTAIVIRYVYVGVFCSLPVLGPSEATEISLKVTADVTDTPCAYCTTWTRKRGKLLLLFLLLDVVETVA